MATAIPTRGPPWHTRRPREVQANACAALDIPVSLEASDVEHGHWRPYGPR